MQKIDGYYLYMVGASIHPLADFHKNLTYSSVHIPILIAHGSLETFLQRSVFRPKICQQTGNELLRVLKVFEEKAEDTAISGNTIAPFDIYQLSTSLNAFESVLGAEFGVSDMYLVAKKRGYDTTELIERGTVLFPADLTLKVPATQLDIEQGARCLAFELPTAAGFHFHRANESVLHRYYDAVTGGKPRPSSRNIGDYLQELNKLNVGSLVVKSALKDLKDLHRNPLIHPEHTIDDIDEAIALLGSIHCVIVHMLKEIPLPPVKVNP